MARERDQSPDLAQEDVHLMQSPSIHTRNWRRLDVAELEEPQQPAMNLERSGRTHEQAHRVVVIGGVPPPSSQEEYSPPGFLEAMVGAPSIRGRGRGRRERGRREAPKATQGNLPSGGGDRSVEAIMPA